MLPVPAVPGRDGAVLGQVPPLGVGERAEMRVDLAQVRLNLGDRSECALDTQIGRDAMERGRRDAGAEVVEDEPPNRRSRQCGELHADVPAKRAADPIDLAHAEARDERAHRRQIQRRGVVFGMLEPLAPAATRQVGRDHAHSPCGEALREHVEIAAVARHAVHADDGAAGADRPPVGISDAHEAVGSENGDVVQTRGPRRCRASVAVGDAQSRAFSHFTIPEPRMPCDLPLTNTPT